MQRMARLFAGAAYLTTAILLIDCSAPGPVLPEVSGSPSQPAIYEMEVLNHRFKENIAAFFQVDGTGRTELWQISMNDAGKIRMFQFIGKSHQEGDTVFRSEKCFLYAKDTPEADLVALEVFTCDHLSFRLYPGDCSGCKVTGPPPYEDELSEASRFLTDRYLTPVPADRYIGKKMDAFSDHTQVWYWGLQRGSMPAAGTKISQGKVRTVLDGFVQVEPGNGPERISIPLPEPEGGLF